MSPTSVVNAAKGSNVQGAVIPSNPDQIDDAILHVEGLAEIDNLNHTSQVLVSFLVSWSHELQRNVAGLRQQNERLRRGREPHFPTIEETDALIRLFDNLGLHATELASEMSLHLCGRIGDWRKEVSDLAVLGEQYGDAVRDRGAKNDEFKKKVKKENAKKSSWWPGGSSSSKTKKPEDGDDPKKRSAKSVGGSDEAATAYVAACERVEHLKRQLAIELNDVNAHKASITNGMRLVANCVKNYSSHVGDAGRLVVLGPQCLRDGH